MHSDGDATLTLVLFRLDAQSYGVSLSCADRVIPMVAMAPLPNAPAIVLGVINFHGQAVPVVDIRRRFGLSPRPYGINSYLLLTRAEPHVFALPVDEVMGIREVERQSVRPPETVLPGLTQITGVTALGEGLLFIHDLGRFLSLEEAGQLGRALDEVAR